MVESADVFTGGLIGDAKSITNFVKGKVRVLGEELKDLDSAMIRDTFHNFLSELALDLVHEGLNWGKGEKLRSLDDLFWVWAKVGLKGGWEDRNRLSEGGEAGVNDVPTFPRM